MQSSNKYGENCRDLFHIDESKTFVNHGSFGRCPDVVRRKRLDLLDENMRDADEFTCDKIPQLYAEAVERTAQFVGSDPKNIVIVDNVTTAINVLLKSFFFKPGDKILVTQHCYEGVRKNVHEYIDYDGIKSVVFPIRVPMKNVSNFIESFEEFLSNHTNVTMAILEHITSASGIVLPLKEMVSMCKQRGIFTAVDGAHAPGQLKLDMHNIDADFYGGNLHKWCYTSSSCGFFYVPEKHHKMIRPLITSHYYNTTLQKPFQHPGTRDLTPYFTVPTALDFFEEMGGIESVTSYTKSLLKWVESYLEGSLDMKPLDIPEVMKASGLLLMQLPDNVIDAKAMLAGRHQWASTVCLQPHNVRVFLTAFDDKAFIRVSCNIYNTKHDYEKLKEALEDYFQNPNKVVMKVW